MAVVTAEPGSAVGDRHPETETAEPAASPEPRAHALDLPVRVAAHATVWSVVLVPSLIELADGWRPVRDDAMLSIGSYQVFSGRSPLVGPWSLASGTHHPFFDLGPLLFWLLAVPVRLDPSHGVLWGAAVVAAVALSVAVEAARSVGGWIAAALVALAVADLGWRTPVFTNPAWNAYFGIAVLAAAAVVAWSVACGRFGWWPVAVLFASVAAQSHLFYAVPACLLVLVAPVIALLLGGRPTRWRWLPVGLAVAGLAWLPTIVQEIIGSPGNLTMVVRGPSAQAPVGLSFGMHALATAAAPRPIWLTDFPVVLGLARGMPRYFDAHAVLWAVVGVLLLGAVVVVARREGRSRVAALSATALVVAAGVTASFVLLPRDNLAPSGYLASVLWLVGILGWIAVVAGAAVLARAAWARRRRPSVDRRVGPRLRPLGGLSLALVPVALLAGATVAAVCAQVPEARAQVANERADVPFDAALARAVERSVPSGSFALRVRPTVFPDPRSVFGAYAVDEWGTAMKLLGDGRDPALADPFAGAAVHLSVPAGQHWRTVVVTIDPATRRVAAVRVLPG
ncbi:MAG: hypothetical protein JO368_01880 [Acidimicrobiales bacterium]|nr:hypothetical protein [Acidimicrobiales bacterium]